MTDWVTQVLTSAPLWVQLIVVLIVVVPLAAAAAWGLLYAITAVWRRFSGK